MNPSLIFLAMLGVLGLLIFFAVVAREFAGVAVDRGLIRGETYADLGSLLEAVVVLCCTGMVGTLVLGVVGYILTHCAQP